MGNTMDKMRQRELERRETKREELLAFLENSKRRQSLLEVNANAGAEEGQNLNAGDADRQQGFGRSQGPGGGGPDDDPDHRLTDRDREAWLYRMENEALDVINDNMELQEERRRERERREERREELEHMGADGVPMGEMDPGGGEDPNAQREEGPLDERTPVSSRPSSLVASDNSDVEDDLVSLDDNVEDDIIDDDDNVEDVDDADVAEDAVSEGAPESERGDAETAAPEEAGGGGGDDEEHRREH